MTSRRLSLEPLEPRTTPVVLTITVTTATDEFDFSSPLVSLREAIFQADFLDPAFERVDIVFDPSLAGADIPVESTFATGGFSYVGESAFEVDSGQPIVIRGSGQRITRAPDPSEPSNYRLFAVGFRSSLTLEDLELVNGREVVGGAVYNQGDLTLNRITLTGNTALGGSYTLPDVGTAFTRAFGGGVFNSFGTLTITNSTLTGNAALVASALPGRGGGVANESGTVTLNYTTLADNSAAEGTQVYSFDADRTPVLTVNFSILSQAGTPTGPALISTGGTAAGVRNLIRGALGFTGEVVSTADPLLAPLANNGGLTRTRGLAFNSPAIDLGETAASVSTDQRGVARPVGPATDLGAFEAPIPPTARLSGFAYIDANDNGVKDAGEVGIAGVTVTLTGRVTRVTTTAADGSYSFDALPFGTYTVTETQPAGLFDGRDTAGSLGGTVADDSISNVVLNPGDDAVNYLFGELTPARLSGFVYIDANNNGIKDPGEAGIPDVIVSLLGGGGFVFANTRADGSYTFTGLPFGTYTVSEFQPAGFRNGIVTAGSRGGTVAGDSVTAIVLGTGDDGVGYNFGERPLFPPVLVVGAGTGGGPHVKVFNTLDGSVVASFFAFDPAFSGGVRVAQGDFNGDGIADYVTAAGPGGGPHVKVFDGATGAVIRSFMAFDPVFAGGVWVAAADVNDDGIADIVAGAGLGGGPHVKVFDGATGATILSFFAFPLAIDCGVTVGCNGGKIVVGTGFGHPQFVKVFDARTGAEEQSFTAFDTPVLDGVFVATLPADGSTLVFAVRGGDPEVRQFEDGTQTGSTPATDTPAVGASIAAGDFDRTGAGDVATGAGLGGVSLVRIFSGFGGAPRLSFLAFDAGFLGGVFVG